MRLRQSGLLAAIALLVAHHSAASTIVYNQTPEPEPFSGRTSQFLTGYGFGFNIYDDFTLAQSALIGEVTWRGFYFNQVSGINPAPKNGTAFTVEFFADDPGNPGFPGAQLLSETFTPAGAAETFVSVQATNLGYSAPVYDYDAELSTGFEAQGGVKYWLRVYETSPLPSATEAQWAWASSTDGDLRSVQYLGPNPDVPQATKVGESGRDRAFELIETPEPATLLLVGTGLLGFARVRRRVR